MSVLICDKSVPFASALAGSLRVHNVSVALLGGLPEGKTPSKSVQADPSALREIPWNRSSVLSARTVLLETRNSFENLDQAVIVFDLPAFTEALQIPEAQAAAIADDYIKGYLLLAGEIAAYFVRRKKGRLVFVVRGFPPAGKEPAGREPSDRAGDVRTLTFAVAEAAFIRLAEELSASFAGTGIPAMQSLLVRLDQEADDETVPWLVEHLLQGAAPRNQGRWIKAGSKGLLGIR